MRWLVIALLLVLSSCSLEHRMEKKFRKAERKIEKLTIRYPKLLKRDTINDTIKITTQEVKVDTIFTPTDGDTVTLFKDKLRIQYVRQGDTVYLSGECQADTIYQTISIPVEQVVVRKQTILEQIQKQSKRMILVLLILVVLAVAIRVLWKFIKPL